ncbi:hypothetical protein V5O48_005789 [Marasmius crinis-equi]|uniref:Uncharacterized protein n=1 Tax=Marasmius crinis-equi TaxID=585013 RepID=A0ABR3FLB5_9AGAR
MPRTDIAGNNVLETGTPRLAQHGHRNIRSESAVKLMAEFLDLDMPYVEGRRHVNAEHFAHELYSYLRSPYKDLFVYDEVAQIRHLLPEETESNALAGGANLHFHLHLHLHARVLVVIYHLYPRRHQIALVGEKTIDLVLAHARVFDLEVAFHSHGRSYPSSRNHDIEVSHLPANLGDMEPNSGWRNDRPHVDGGSASPNLINYPSSPSPRHASPDAYRYSRRSHHAVPPAPSSGQLSIKGRGKRKAGAAAVGVPETSRPRGRSDSRGSEEHPEVSDEMNGALATITYPHERPASEINEFNHPATVPSDTTSDEVITEAAASREPRRSGYGDTGTRGQDPHIQISTTFGAVTKSRNRNLVDSVQAHLNWNRNGQLPSERPGAQGSRRPGPTAITHMPSPPPVETESGPRPSLLLRLSDVFTGDDPGTVDEDSGIHDIMSEPISKLDSTPRPRQPIHSERMTEKLEEPGPVSTGASPFFSADSVVAIDTSTSSKPNTDNPHDRLTQLRDQLRSARSSSQGSLGQPSFDEQLRNGHSSSNESHLDRNTGLIPSPSFSQAPSNHGVMNDGRSHVGLSAPPAEPVDHVTDMDLQDSNGQTGITERDPRNTLLRKLDQEKQKAQSGSSIPTVSSTPVVDANAMEARLRTRARLKARLASEKRSGAAADSSKG